jgi:hypothetical protein
VSRSAGRGLRYLHEGTATNDPVLKDEVPEGRDDETAEETVHAKLPRLLALSGAGIDAGHEEDDVEGGEGVEDLACVSGGCASWCGRSAP